MSFLLRSGHILLAAICGLVNQRQRQLIEFQNAQIEALLKKLGRKRLLFDNDQRRLSFLTLRVPVSAPEMTQPFVIRHIEGELFAGGMVFDTCQFS